MLAGSIAHRYLAGSAGLGIVPSLRERLQTLPAWLWLGAGFAALVLLYAPSIPWCGAWDPWETHYGEVARNIVVRSDPLDLWWTPSRWGPDRRYESLFSTKHVLPFWLMAASLELFQVGASRDPTELAFSPVAELALRLPSMIAGFATIGVVLYVVKRCVSMRAGVLCAFVLATMPLFALVSRQALTDMFLAGPVMLAWGAWAMAWFVPNRDLRRRRFGPVHLPWDRAYTSFLALLLIAAVVPLAVLQHHVVADVTVARVAKFAAKPDVPDLDTLSEIARQLAPYWLLAVAIVAISVRWKTRRDVWLGLLYLATGVAVLGKGILGPALVGVVIVVDCWVASRLGRLRHTGLLIGVLLLIIVAVPWHHAMAIYRGERWVRELIFENNLARFSSGEQDQAVGTAMFYVRTLGLAAFPWSAVLPAVIWRATKWLAHPCQMLGHNNLDRSDQTPTHQSIPSPTPDAQLRRFACVAATLTFVTLTYSVTKYNHYLLPCLPPLAIVVGIWLADSPTDFDVRRRPHAIVVAAACLLCGALIIRELVETPAWIAHLTTVYYDGIWRDGAPSTRVTIWLALPSAVAILAWCWRKRTLAAVAIVAGAVAFTGYVLDVYLPQASQTWSQRDMFRHYYEHREEEDRLVSWWLHHRGETYFSKRRLWMSVSPRKDELNEYIAESHAQDRGVWIVTTQRGKKRLRSAVPRRLRQQLAVAYENEHHVLMQLPPP